MSKLHSAILITTVVCLTTETHAAVVFYNDKAAWQAANLGFLSDDFVGVAQRALLVNTDEDIGLFTVRYETSGNVNESFNQIQDSQDRLVLSLDEAGTDRTTLMTFKFDNPITGFAFDINALDADTEEWQFTVDGENFNISDVIDPSSNITNLAGFAGFTTSNPISSITVPNLPISSNEDAVGFLEVFVNEAEVIPEPGTMTLLAIGSCLIGGTNLRRRRR